MGSYRDVGGGKSGGNGICSQVIEPPTITMEPRFPQNEECGLGQDRQEGNEDDPLDAHKARAYAVAVYILKRNQNILKP